MSFKAAPKKFKERSAIIWKRGGHVFVKFCGDGAPIYVWHTNTPDIDLLEALGDWIDNEIEQVGAERL